MISSDPVSALSDEALLAELASCAELRRAVDARAAALGAEIKRRSDRELGYAGLAQSKGARTAEILVQQVTGLSKAEAAAVVRVGSRPEFLDAVKPEAVGVAKVDAVRRGLGDVSETVSSEDLAGAAEQLAMVAPGLSAEELAARARGMRDELDAQNIEDRVAAQRDERYLSLTRRMDGMYTVHGLLDPESAMVIKTATDAIIAPRRGGPRFVDKEKAAEQEKLAAEDTRTIGQMTVDAVVDLIKVAISTAEGAVLTGHKGHVTLHTVQTAEGVTAGYFEGELDAVSADIVERYLCDSSTSVVGFVHGAPVDSSTDQRLFNRRQRRAHAAMWGGCAFPGCTRPPSWTEAHHIKPWATGHHKTETLDGIPLCRHHHMLLHNNGWHITRIGLTYYLHDPNGNTTRLEPKSPLYRKHRGGAPQPRPQPAPPPQPLLPLTA